MSRRSRSFGVLILALGCCVLITCVLAQTTAGIINGTVRDASGAIVPDAEVTASNLDTSVKNVAKTNGNGDFYPRTRPDKFRHGLIQEFSGERAGHG